MRSELERYSRQVLFPGLGEQGQQRLMSGRALICGCGALGSVLAETMARAGTGFLRIVDRDFVDLSNLQRQVLFNERHVADRLPKAVAAAEVLHQINSEITVEPIVADVDHTNIRQFVDGVDVILDGSDNFEIRFLVNDVALETGIPWVYAGCVSSHGQTMAVFPNETACLRCLIDTVPEPGATETCDTAGVLGAAVTVDGMKILAGRRELVAPTLTVVDVWDGSFRTMNVKDLRERSNCPACVQGERVWLAGMKGSQTTVLCGRNAVQISPQEKATLSFDDLANRLRDAGQVSHNPYLLRLQLRNPECDITVFRDGRAIIKGIQDVSAAKALYARYVGH